MSNDLESVSISIGSSMYQRFEDLPNTVSHDLAEFIDNALQSYRDSKPLLQGIDKDYKLKISIDIEWDGDKKDARAKNIKIEDNAAGINYDRYLTAFQPAKTPENNKGLNEFGMGLKTAACWLGQDWIVITKAINEDVERTIHFNLEDVNANKRESLPVQIIPTDLAEHYTIVTISETTKNAPTLKSLPKIKTEIASIYRNSLRNNELEIFVCGEKLSFTEYEILNKPFVREPKSTPIYWKKEIDFKFGKYEAKGFIALLKKMNKDQNRIVLLRRGRVIVGAESEGHYYSKFISGTQGSPRDKRIFGELELKGFDVTFNKNDIQDKDNLEALFEALVPEIHSKGFDLLTQAQEYREDENTKHVKNLVKKHNNASKKGEQTTIKLTTTKDTTDIVKEPITEDYTSSVIDKYIDKYEIDGKEYSLKVQFIDNMKDTQNLFWTDISQKNENIIVCNVNTNHLFFKNFGKYNPMALALIKTMSIAQFTSKVLGNDSSTDMYNYFNEYIKKTRI